MPGRSTVTLCRIPAVGVWLMVRVCGVLLGQFDYQMLLEKYLYFGRQSLRDAIRCAHDPMTKGKQVAGAKRLRWAKR